ncbi:ATP-binding protein [Halobacillus mangrovi]|nr:ATP-binding protein [Halobacillus mangrovi]
MSTKTRTVPPHASRMIEGLRDTGYEFNTAIADIIDNSIAANATLIDIKINMDFAGDVIIRIGDNGSGMDEEGLINAMTYGSSARPTPKSLGKFGLGLKTASTAFCRRLSVSTRDDELTSIQKACWDLDHVAKTNDWEILFPEPEPEEVDLLDDVSDGGSGTVVTWEKVDRLLKSYQDQTGTYAQRALDKVIEKLREHVAMVYQQYLDPIYQNITNIDIKINGEIVEPWDPFCISEPNTELVAECVQPVKFEDGRESSFSIKAYVLPRKEQFTSVEAQKQAKLSNDMQGFYVYRENRLIHHGDWMGMVRNEPHSTLLRVEFSFDYNMDDAFNVDIKKSRISLNNDLYNWIKDQFLPAPRRAANDRYRTGVKKNVTKASKGAHEDSNSNIKGREKDLQRSTFEITNPDTNEVQVTNSNGNTRITLPLVTPTREGEVFVQPVDSIDDGLLWEPALIDKHPAVRINTNHPYYHKVYVPNLSSGVTVQGMDSLLWACSQAELWTISDVTKRNLKELRYETSRLLRQLVEDLPDPELNDGSD